jgi:hypothetical protein
MTPDALPTASASDALLIARWCWPGVEYREDEWGNAVEVLDCQNLFLRNDWRAIHHAERILIERGHAEAYGKALMQQDGIEIHYCDSNSMSDHEFCAEAAKLATAPLDARVRALAATIRALSPQGRPVNIECPFPSSAFIDEPLETPTGKCENVAGPDCRVEPEEGE